MAGIAGIELMPAPSGPRDRRIAPKAETMNDLTPLPPGTCNAHCHVFGPRERFPYVEQGSFVPERDAPKEMLHALHARLGITRCVVVQSTCHGFDNRATEDALQSRPRTFRGIALLPTDVKDAELRRLDASGFRGVRFNYMRHLGQYTPVDAVLALASRLAPLGWHLQIHGEPSLLTDLGPALRCSPVPVVIDHIGRIDASLGPDQPHFRALRGLMEDKRFWVKVSGCERITRQPWPYDDATPFARALVESFGDRVVWGLDWPHPNFTGPVPTDDQLVALLPRIAPDPVALRRLLVDNPVRLYGFDADALA
jgi:2-pyrone-4,6-dicarboxylate lactonase